MSKGGRIEKVKMNYEYDVVLSFAGEDRSYVDRVAKYLTANGTKVFYDKYEEADLWGKDLYVHLDDIYRNKARYCVMFLSKDYASKVWTNHERESAQARSFGQKEEYILPARFDNTEIPGVRPTVGYIDLRKVTPEKFGELILEKINKKTLQNHEESLKAFRKPKMLAHQFNPYDEAQKFMDFVSNELKNRCSILHSEGISLSVFTREGHNCFRVVYNSKTQYSLDMWLGGFFGDSSIGFYGVPGEPHFSSGSSNAHGSMCWSNDHNAIVMQLNDMSLLNILGTRLYTKDEFVDALWDKICDTLDKNGLGGIG